MGGGALKAPWLISDTFHIFVHLNMTKVFSMKCILCKILYANVILTEVHMLCVVDSIFLLATLSRSIQQFKSCFK